MYRYTKLAFASIFLGLATTFAQGQVQGTIAPGQVQATTVTPPLFQGIMVDAKGKTVGRLFSAGGNGQYVVVRQISGVWVELPIDTLSAFYASSLVPTYYQSADCTGQPYFPVDFNRGTDVLSFAFISIIPPATAPTIYFAGTPISQLTVKSFQYQTPSGTTPQGCQAVGNANLLNVGLPQSVPVSSLGLTLPFKVK